jgi:hypothetical protein
MDLEHFLTKLESELESNSIDSNCTEGISACPTEYFSPGLEMQLRSLSACDGSLGQWLAALDADVLEFFCEDVHLGDIVAFGIVATVKEVGRCRDDGETLVNCAKTFKTCVLVEAMRRAGVVRIIGELGMTTNAIIESVRKGSHEDAETNTESNQLYFPGFDSDT